MHKQSIHLHYVHGLFGKGQVMTRLARKVGYQYTCHDLPNHGQAARVSSMHPENLAHHLARQIPHDESTHTIFVAHSMGVRVVLECLKRLPHASAVLIDAPLTLRLDGIRGYLELLSRTDIRDRLLQTYTRTEASAMLDMYPDLKPVRNILLSYMENRDDRLYFPMHPEAWDALYADLSLPFISMNPMPNTVLVVRGGLSDFLLPQDHAAYKEVFPECVWNEIPNAGHMLHLTHAEECATIIQSWLSSL